MKTSYIFAPMYWLSDTNRRRDL